MIADLRCNVANRDVLRVITTEGYYINRQIVDCRLR